MNIRAVSYGGGVQSTALLVLAAQRRIDFPLFLMANVGDDSEHPATLAYVRDIAAPYAAKHGIELVLLEAKYKGEPDTLMQRIERGIATSGNSPIPARMPNGAPMSRNCTETYKVDVLARWLKANGATPSAPAVVGMGISLDEIHRANPNKNRQPYRQVVYPLIGIGEETGLKLNRLDCERVIADAGIPVPPKSSCYFCPFHTPVAWADLARETPELFDKAADLERRLNETRSSLGKPNAYLTRFGIPLRQAINTTDELLPLADEDGSCDSGWCFT